MEESDNTVQIQKKDHLFKPGQSGNPKGRPKGALNKTTRAAMVLLENEAEDLTRKLVELAKGGDLLPSEGRTLVDILEARRKARRDEEDARIFGSLFGKSSSTSAEDDEEEEAGAHFKTHRKKAS